MGEDLSVMGPTGGKPAMQAARQAQGQLLAATIRARAGALLAVDSQVAGKLSAAIADVNAVQFGDTSVATPPRKRKPQIQAVDFGPKPADPVVTPSGPTGDDIRRVLEQLPEGDSRKIREVRSQQDLDNLWKWMQQNGAERPGGYRNEPGVMKNLPDGTIIGRRDVAGSTKLPALDVNVPGHGFIKVHINPRVPELPAAVRAVLSEGSVLGSAPVRPPTPEAAPRIGGIPIIGGPGTPIGPTPVPPPHSVPHPPILGKDDLDAPWEYEE